jgi:DNA-binding transcriptional MerR regulator
MKATLAQTAREKYDLRAEEIIKRQMQVSNRLTKSLDKMEPVTEPTQYMRNKGNYRYYSSDQLAVANVIRTLQESGMSLSG